MIQGEGTKQVKKQEISYKKFNVDFNAPVSNKLLSLETAINYLESNIKVNGLKKNLENLVKVSGSDKKEKSKNNILVQVDNKMKFSKRYIKYLVKKLLKRENIISYLRVVAQGPNSYVVKIFQKNE